MRLALARRWYTPASTGWLRKMFPGSASQDFTYCSSSDFELTSDHKPPSMRLSLHRKWFTDKSTIGELYISGVLECLTLEDPVRADPNPSTPANEAKVPGRTAIPDGRYQISLQKPTRVLWSPRPDGALPRLRDVPGFMGIFIHAGNTPEDTEGCILVGRLRDPDRIWSSRLALSTLLTKLTEGLHDGDVWIDVETHAPEES